ncbi:MBL fold metallo-hydrolase [Microbacterium invictum]|nr:MBL fold metallo-hydrolase [Microbacterium aquimaris]
MPEGHWIDSANVYALRDAHGDVHLVDAGWDTDAAWGALEQGLRSLGHEVTGIRSLTLTHLHQDHRGLAERIRARSGARVAMHRADAAAQALPRGTTEAELRAWAVPPPRWPELLAAVPAGPAPTTIDRLLDDGDRLGIPGLAVTVVHTPGHSLGSICLALPDEQLLVTGDHVLPDFYPGVGLNRGGAGDDALAEYVNSLERLAPMFGWRGLPGHGGVIPEIGVRVDATIKHQLKRGEAAREIRRRELDATVWQIAGALRWGPGWEGLRPWHRVSALRQTAMHLRFTSGD